jgi:hypothetical protein
MADKMKTGHFSFSMMLAICLLLISDGLQAQERGSASARASIVSSRDISSIDMISADGTQFMVRNSENSCYNVITSGLTPELQGNAGSQKVTYNLILSETKSASFDMISIRLAVQFPEPVNNGIYLAKQPYTISVNYN